MITRPEDIENHDGALSRAEFWQKAAAVSFGAWALVLPAAAALVVSSVSRFTDKFDTYILQMEKRVTLLEERQARVLRVLEDQSVNIEKLRDKPHHDHDERAGGARR